jgi:hypothetical protein
MKRTHPIARMALAALLAMLVTPAALGVGTGGTGLRVYAHGALSLAGGIVVKGITFDASRAAITINGQAGHSSDDLLPGMVAGVDGSFVPGLQVGVADSIHVTRVVRAMVLYVGTGGTGLRIQMAGIDVIPRTDVVVAGCASLAEITVGTMLDVYGYSDGITGTVDATRIECVGPSGEVELHGVASAITPSSMVVDGVTVDISAAQFIAFTMPITAGDRVEVEGTATATGIIADTVTFEPEDDGSSNGEDAEVEDAISAIVSPLVFIVDKFEIDATNAKFSGGTAADLAVGRVVHVEGHVVNGAINAKSIEFDDDESDDGRAGPGTGPAIEDVDGAISAFTSIASFVVHGVTVDASAATFVNGVATDLAVGNVVKVLGTLTGMTMKATKVTVITGSGGDDGMDDSGDHGSGGAGPGSGGGTPPPGTFNHGGDHGSGGAGPGSGGGTPPPGTSNPPSGGHDGEGHPGHVDGSSAGSAEAEGRVASLISPGVFTVGSVTVDARSARISHGSLSDIREGTRVHATGAMQSGVLMATRIELDD